MPLPAKVEALPGLDLDSADSKDLKSDVLQEDDILSTVAVQGTRQATIKPTPISMYVQKIIRDTAPRRMVSSEIIYDCVFLSDTRTDLIRSVKE